MYIGFKTFNVSIGSERKQRKLAKLSQSGNLVAERGSFTFSVDRGEEIKEVSFVCSPNLVITIAELVDKHDRCFAIKNIYTILNVVYLSGVQA